MNRRKLACLALLCLGACGKPAPEDSDRKLVSDTLLELDLTEAPAEQRTALLGQERPSHFEGLMRLRALTADPLAKGLFVRIGGFGGQFADVDDWAQTLESFRAAKKPVHCHFDEVDNTGYALAAHCDKLSMTPAGMLDLVGLALQAIHGRTLLDTLGVQAELLQVGKYKGAAESFTRAGMSDEQRVSLDTLLTDLDAAFRAHLGKRVPDPAAVQKLIDGGPYTAEAAQAAGLIDAIAFDDEARAHAKKAAGARIVQRTLAPKEGETLSLSDLTRLLGGRREHDYDGRAHLAVGFLVGDIRDGDTQGVSGASSEPFIRTLRRWGDAPDVRAVVLRIESPGGSALASDRMWHAVQRVARRKPVVVSLGDMAASGGYYIASAGNLVVAAPGSIVGSIGVLGGKVVVSQLAEKVGVSVTSLTRSARSDWLSPFHSFTPAERGALERMLQDTYGRFVARVALGRKRDAASLAAAAEGRVMGGERAKELGLVDEVGGLARAVTLALEQGKLPERAPIEVWPDANDSLAAISSLLGARHVGGGATGALSGALREELPGALREAGGLAHTLLHAGDQPLVVLPFALHVR